MEASRIVRLQAENVKRLSAVEITPRGDVVVVGGQNGAGKTSVLDSIEMALAGAKALPPEPIRQGEEKARVVVDLGTIVVERRFWRDKSGETKSKLVVSNKEGADFRSPQAILDQLVGELAFDPLGFARQSPSSQRATLLALAGVDFAALDDEREGLYSERTNVGREGKSLAARLDGVPFDPEAPEHLVSIADLAEEVDRRRAAHAAREEHEATILRLAEEREGLNAQIEGIRRQLAVAVETAARTDAQLKALRASLEAQPALEPMEPLLVQVKEADATNERVRRNRAHIELAAEVARLKGRWSELTAAIEDVDARKEQALREAKLPVPELGVSDRGVTIAGVPFEQASQAEQLRVSVAMGLALNPRLRVVLIRDGSLMDAQSMELIAQLAREYDAQLWVERVGSGDESAIIIEDGHVREP